MSNFEERILVGIIDPHTYVTKSNNKDCSYVDIAFEQFTEEYDKNRHERYGIVNQEKFLDEVPKVFLTSNAKNSIAKFGEEHLIRLVANTSPEERGCKYTVHNEKMSRVDPYDFVEIVEPRIENLCATERVAFMKYRPSTDYVVVKCTKFIVDKEDFPFVSKTEEFFRREDAEKYLKDCFYSAYGEITLDNAGSFIANNIHAVTELNRRFFSSINRIVCSDLTDEELENGKPDENRIRESVREGIKKLSDDNGFLSYTAARVANGIRAKVGVENALAKLGHDGDDVMAEDGSDKNSEDAAVTGNASEEAAVAAEPAAPVQLSETVSVSDREAAAESSLSSASTVLRTTGTKEKSGTGSFAEGPSGRGNEYIITETTYRADTEKWKNGYLKDRVESGSSNDPVINALTESMDFTIINKNADGSGASSLGKAVNRATREIRRSYNNEFPSVHGLLGIVEEEEEEEAQIPEYGDSMSKVDVPRFSDKLLSLIKTREVLLGPFVVGKFKQSEDGGEYACECVLNIPDKRCQLAVKDDMNSCVKSVEYDLLQDYIKEVNVNGTVRRYLVQMPVQSWLNSGRKHDLIDDKKLIDNYAPTLLNPVFKDLNTNQLSKVKQNIQGLSLFKNEHDRVMRCFNILQGVVEFDNERNRFFNMLMKTSKFQEFFNTYINNNLESILANYRKDLFSSVKKEKDREQKELERINSEIAQKKKVLNTLKNKVEAEGQSAEVLKDTSAAAARDTQIQVKVKGKIVSSEDHETLKSEYRKLMNEYESLKKQVGELRRTKDNIDEELNHSFADLSSRYLEMHSMLKAFTTPRQVKESGFNFDSGVPSVINIDNINKGRKRYIEELLSSMKSYGRSISVEKLVSMVVTIAQNQFTILAGLPGSGKTSFVKTMGKALNLGNRLHTIPVARGWTSQRDIMGYWNSLTSSFQPAPTGLWELLTTLDAEKDMNGVTPAILLLDEMNLSSPEHYFSSFMQLADADTAAERKIFTGSPEKAYLTIPSYLRFVGTVNSDDTVNIMSARMLDRSAVILFDEKPSQSDDNRTTKIIPHAMQTTYSAADWMSLFDTEDGRIQNKMYAVLNDVEEILYKDDSKLGQRIVVSYRKHQQIINYLSVVDPLLASLKNCDNETIAMDFAIKQFVLPMINGFGESFGNRLEELLNILDKYNLSESQTVLQRIISEGEDRMNSYQFLA